MADPRNTSFSRPIEFGKPDQKRHGKGTSEGGQFAPDGGAKGPGGTSGGDPRDEDEGATHYETKTAADSRVRRALKDQDSGQPYAGYHVQKQGPSWVVTEKGEEWGSPLANRIFKTKKAATAFLDGEKARVGGAKKDLPEVIGPSGKPIPGSSIETVTPGGGVKRTAMEEDHGVKPAIRESGGKFTWVDEAGDYAMSDPFDTREEAQAYRDSFMDDAERNSSASKPVDLGGSKATKPAGREMKDGSTQIDHKAYPEYVKSLDDSALTYTIRDAAEAMSAMPEGHKAGYYADEIHYAAMELKQRRDA